MKTTYCLTCCKAFHPLGIARHRAGHRDRRERCTIMYSNGDTYDHEFNGMHDAEAQKQEYEQDCIAHMHGGEFI